MNSDRQTLMLQFENSVQKFRGSRFKRLLKHPWSTLKASVIWRLVHKAISGRYVLNVRAKTFFGKHLLVTIPPAYDLWVSGLYLDASEVRLIRYLIRELDKGQTIFDVGANFGYFSMLAAELVGTTGSVYAFEPSPTAISFLRKNIDRYDQIHTVEKAVSDAKGTAEFLAGCGAYVGNSSLNADYIRANVRDDMHGFESTQVEATTLDDFCGANDLRPDFIKIDVEGAEDKVLSGASETLARYAPIIAMEVWFEIRSSGRERSLEILQEHGYTPFGILEEGNVERLSFATLDSYWERIKQSHDFYHGLDNIVFKRIAPNG